MTTRHLKIAGLTTLALAFAAGSAFAGEGKDCDKKHAMKTQASTAQQTSVMGATEKGAVMVKADKKMKKTYSFDDALKICQEKGAADLQACIDYKTGKTEYKAKPKS
ncbi:MAG: hypothetical protein EX271_05600 [Acidimicrobiales bacterium]|nr:hypothetical protein [Hyphomonadaceae bacterium]RZV42582.1 MAG: hypothetical protein EX271_05600 [Acidimicrobiales bacterium]